MNVFVVIKVQECLKIFGHS